MAFEVSTSFLSAFVNAPLSHTEVCEVDACLVRAEEASDAEVAALILRLEEQDQEDHPVTLALKRMHRAKDPLDALLAAGETFCHVDVFSRHVVRFAAMAVLLRGNPFAFERRLKGALEEAKKIEGLVVREYPSLLGLGGKEGTHVPKIMESSTVGLAWDRVVKKEMKRVQNEEAAAISLPIGFWSFQRKIHQAKGEQLSRESKSFEEIETWELAATSYKNAARHFVQAKEDYSAAEMFYKAGECYDHLIDARSVKFDGATLSAQAMFRHAAHHYGKANAYGHAVEAYWIAGQQGFAGEAAQEVIERRRDLKFDPEVARTLMRHGIDEDGWEQDIRLLSAMQYSFGQALDNADQPWLAGLHYVDAAANALGVADEKQVEKYFKAALQKVKNAPSPI